jgi:hypothetical protein
MGGSELGVLCLGRKRRRRCVWVGVGEMIGEDNLPRLCSV